MLVVNLKKEKSAALFALRGKGKLQVETDLYNTSDVAIKFDAGSKQQYLHVALDYKHVACFLQCNGSHAKEFRHRSGTASSSLTLLRRKVVSRAVHTQRTKSTVTQAVSFGQLYNGKHTDSRPAPSIDKGDQAVHIRVAKAIIGWKPDASWMHTTADEILAQAALPSFECMTSAARLRHLERFIAIGPDHLLALVEIAAPLKTLAPPCLEWHCMNSQHFRRLSHC